MFPVKMEAKKLVLLCIDGSEHAERAFNWYHDNLHQEKYELGLLHVHVQPDGPAVGLFSGGAAAVEVYQTEIGRSVEDSKAIIKKYQEMCQNKGVHAKVLVQSKEQSVGHTICKIAKDEGAVHIVVGSRGLGAVRRTFMGSVSSYILHHTHIPTTVIPPPETIA